MQQYLVNYKYGWLQCCSMAQYNGANTEQKAKNLLVSVTYTEIVDSWETPDNVYTTLKVTDKEQTSYVISSINDLGFQISSIDWDNQEIRVRG